MILDNVSTSTATADGRAAADKQKLDNDLNRFLTLLVTQLQNQDPLEPLDANEFTSQLVQFASVEQQIYQNANLEKLLAAQNGSQLTTSVGYIGHLVEASGSALPLQDGTAEAIYRLPEAAAEARITIRDEDGRAVYSAPVAKDAGEHAVVWDGRDQNGRQLPDGSYRFQIDARDRTGAAMTVAQGFSGVVTGVASGTDGTVLQLGGMELPLDQVTAVRERPEQTLQAE